MRLIRQKGTLMARKKVTEQESYWKRVDDKIVRAMEKHPPAPPAENPYAAAARDLLAAHARDDERRSTVIPEGHVRVGYDRDGVVTRPIEPTEQPSKAEISKAVKRTERALVKRGACPVCFYTICVCKARKARAARRK